MKLPYTATGWKTAPISPTCEYMDGSEKQPRFCGKPTDFAYPAFREGWCALCVFHAKPLHPSIFRIEEVIHSGERFS